MHGVSNSRCRNEKGKVKLHWEKAGKEEKEKRWCDEIFCDQCEWHQPNEDLQRWTWPVHSMCLCWDEESLGLSWRWRQRTYRTVVLFFCQMFWSKVPLTLKSIWILNRTKFKHKIVSKTKSFYKNLERWWKHTPAPLVQKFWIYYSQDWVTDIYCTGTVYTVYISHIGNKVRQHYLDQQHRNCSKWIHSYDYICW